MQGKHIKVVLQSKEVKHDIGYIYINNILDEKSANKWTSSKRKLDKHIKNMDSSFKVIFEPINSSEVFTDCVTNKKVYFFENAKDLYSQCCKKLSEYSDELGL